MLQKRRGIHARIAFFCILFLTMVPLYIFTLESTFFHEIHQTPRVVNGVLDLAGFRLTNQRALPLDGQWEFYSGRQIIAESTLPSSADLMAPVPLSWSYYPGLGLQSKGVGSYRIVVKNAPDEELVVHIPGIYSGYHAYINGVLVSSRNDADIESIENNVPISEENHRFHGVKLPPGVESELVIELYSQHIGGMYRVPVLEELETNHKRTDLRNLFASALVGIVIVCIGCMAFLLIMGDKLLSSYALLLIDLLVFIRILFHNNYLSFLNKAIPIREYMLNSTLQVIALLLPAVFLYCAHQLVHIKISNAATRFTMLYVLILFPLLLCAVVEGRLKLVFVLSVLSYLPFIYVIWVLYQSVKQRVAYSLSVSAVLLLVISGMLVSTFCDAGWLIINVSLFPPVCLTFSMLIQLGIFIRRSIDIQRKAVEAENLQLRLKESEISLMLSQIKPHFLYNTLIAIHMLCTEEPETAAETVLTFASFLRTNLNFSHNHALVPFEQELLHIQNYVDIEKLRYQERLTFRYEIGATDFLVPPLSIQPLVENAICHGACKNINGGTVVLISRETETHFYIEVIDDGPGFDVRTLEDSSTVPHGLQNIQFRLLEQSHAEIIFDSTPESGTYVTVILPKEDHFENSTAG